MPTPHHLPQELEDELAALKAAMARLLGISPADVTVEYLNSRQPLEENQPVSTLRQELLDRANNPNAQRLLQEAKL